MPDIKNLEIMRKIKNILFSMELTGILLMLFAISIGYATFIENDFGTITAKAKVYNALWFEIMLSLLAINMMGSIVKYKMYLRPKWTMLLFHVAFLIIFAGAAITRYIGYEGVMAIREGQASNTIRSDQTFVTITAMNGTDQAIEEKKVVPSPLYMDGLKMKLNFASQDIRLKVDDYYINAAETFEADENGEPIVWLVISTGNSGRQTKYLKKGDLIQTGGIEIGFERKPLHVGINLHLEDNQLMMSATDSVHQNNMMAKIEQTLAPDSSYLFPPMVLHNLKGVSIVMKQFFPSAKRKIVSAEVKQGMGAGMDGFLATITVGDQSKDVVVYGGKGMIGEDAIVDFGDLKVKIYYGSKNIQLPFAIRLEDFQLERYPGSNSPSSYASEVTLMDKGANLVMPYRIYMNNVLNYKGFRFFQSSYDRDEMGTILSVNHDIAGTIITYIGYFLLALGFILTIFNKNSRFKKLIVSSGELRNKRKELLILLVTVGMAFGQTYKAKAAETNDYNIPVISAEHAEKFGTLLIQDKDGRIKPVNTLASEILRKIARKTSFEGMDPDQVLLGIMAYPEIWEEVPIIKVAHPQLQEFLQNEGSYSSFNKLVDLRNTGQYKISEYVELAYEKKPAEQSKFDKEVMKVDERVNIFYMVYSGSFMNVFPIPGDDNHTWVSNAESKLFTNSDESLFVSGILSMYLDEVRKAIKSGNWTAADEHLGFIKQFQQKNGAKIIPSSKKVNMEITYNKINIFKRLSMYYGLIGFILIILHFVNILKPRLNLKIVIRISSGIVVFLFLLHTVGLIFRWNISGHAPWSNGYESMIYIAWATSLSGLIFVWRSEITLAVTALLSSIILAVAGMSWMDPEITNLVPVLKSYWLVIHVAIITASYGFLALGGLLGFFNLVLMLLKTKKNYIRLDLTITEMTYIIEMTLIIGLFMLTIGTFLGGVWANESWGRYWGWDPKETWALVTVLVYSFVMHMRFIPGFRGNFAMSYASLISYSSVLMTYFGVNYYLSGLHSYAAGDPVPVPTFVYYTVAVFIIIGIWGYVREQKFSMLKSQKK